MFLNLLPYAHGLPEIGVQTKILKKNLQNQQFGSPGLRTRKERQHTGTFPQRLFQDAAQKHNEVAAAQIIAASLRDSRGHPYINSTVRVTQVAPFRSEPTLPLILSSLETTPLFGCHCCLIAFR